MRMTRAHKESPKPLVYRVLLVEENTKELEYYSGLIREVAKCKIDVVSEIKSSIKESVDWLDRSHYHLVIITQEDSSLEILEQIKRTSPSISVILISEKATVESAVGAIRMGAEDYLSKPFKLDAFQLAVKRGLDRQTLFGDESDDTSAYLHLLNCCQLVSAAREQKKIFEIIQSYFLRELNASYSSIYIFNENKLKDKKFNDSKFNDKKAVPVSHSQRSDQTDETLEEILDIALRTNNPLPSLVSSTEICRFIPRGHLTPGLFIFRFSCLEQAEYFLVCLSPKAPTSLEAFESRLRLLKMQIEVTGKNIEQYLGVQQLAYVDDVTGLYNTRYLHYILDREISHSQLTSKSFAVLFIDADHFKLLNDTYGHPVGTKTLNELGKQLSRFVREKDTVFRYGGDEFVAVLSDCDLPTAQRVAERIRDSVAKTSFLESEDLDVHLTISIGVALFPNHAKTKKDIIEAADNAMYNAKKVSRNRVFISNLAKPHPKKT